MDHFGDTLYGCVEPEQPELLPFDSFDNVLRMLYVAVASAAQGKELRAEKMY